MGLRISPKVKCPQCGANDISVTRTDGESSRDRTIQFACTVCDWEYENSERRLLVLAKRRQALSGSVKRGMLTTPTGTNPAITADDDDQAEGLESSFRVSSELSFADDEDTDPGTPSARESGDEPAVPSEKADDTKPQPIARVPIGVIRPRRRRPASPAISTPPPDEAASDDPTRKETAPDDLPEPPAPPAGEGARERFETQVGRPTSFEEEVGETEAQESDAADVADKATAPDTPPSEASEDDGPPARASDDPVSTPEAEEHEGTRAEAEPDDEPDVSEDGEPDEASRDEPPQAAKRSAPRSGRASEAKRPTPSPLRMDDFDVQDDELVLVGFSGAGKTSFLAALWTASHGHVWGDWQVSVRAADIESIDFLSELEDQLSPHGDEPGTFPEPTGGAGVQQHDLAFDVFISDPGVRKFQSSIRIPDRPGRLFNDLLQAGDELITGLSKARGLILFVDVVSLMVDVDGDSQRRADAIMRRNLNALAIASGRVEQLSMPVAVVIGKADRYLGIPKGATDGEVPLYLVRAPKLVGGVPQPSYDELEYEMRPLDPPLACDSDGVEAFLAEQCGRLGARFRDTIDHFFKDVSYHLASSIGIREVRDDDGRLTVLPNLEIDDGRRVIPEKLRPIGHLDVLFRFTDAWKRVRVEDAFFSEGDSFAPEAETGEEPDDDPDNRSIRRLFTRSR